jgi:CheY-like chemotaxis protein
MHGISTDTTRGNRKGVQIEMTRALVAGDDPPLLREVRGALLAQGYEISVSSGAHDVKRLAREIAWAGRRSAVELAVLVARRNVWKTLGIIEHMRRSTWALPVIFITEADDDVRREAERVGVDAIVDLPLHRAKLLQAAMELAPIVPVAPAPTAA